MLPVAVSLLSVAAAQDLSQYALTDVSCFHDTKGIDDVDETALDGINQQWKHLSGCCPSPGYCQAGPRSVQWD